MLGVLSTWCVPVFRVVVYKRGWILGLAWDPARNMAVCYGGRRDGSLVLLRQSRSPRQFVPAGTSPNAPRIRVTALHNLATPVAIRVYSRVTWRNRVAPGSVVTW